LQIKASGVTDAGLKREGNEDAFSTQDSLGLYVVADGMGGHVAGEVASRIAVEMVNKSFHKWISEKATENDLYGPPDSSLTLWGNYILSSIRMANKIVYELALEHKEYHGMGTTIVILLITPTLIITANVGDSRIYMVRDGKLERLSRDHTFVAEQIEMGLMTEEEGETSHMKHILTRNFGSAEEVEPDIFEIEPNNNDRFVLCTDGLTDLVEDEEILEMTSNEDDPDVLCHKFLDTVLKRGAHDNTTVVSVFLSDMEQQKRWSLRKIGLFLSGLVKLSRK
jgi:serine/threonine protein phosphatase PrpC